MSGFSHFVHLILCLLTGFLWIPVYILSIVGSGNSKRKQDLRMKEEELQLLRKIAGRGDK